MLACSAPTPSPRITLCALEARLALRRVWARRDRRGSSGSRRVFAAAVALLALVSSFAPDLRYPEDRLAYDALRSTRYLAADGTVLFERPAPRGGFGTPVELEQMSPWLVAATIAGEDHNFRLHPGVDPVGVGRAVLLNARAGRLRYGGSTLTQQLAKLLHREPRTLAGKLYEAWAAFQLEHSLSKDEILAQYLNRAYYGRNATGVEAAAERFFGKRASELALDEAVLLAVLPRSPSSYDPERFPERARARRAHVLELMQRRGFVSAEQARHAASRPIALLPRGREPRLRHAVDQLLQREAPGGEVQTSLDVQLQQRIERQLEGHLLRIREHGAEQAAVLVLRNQDARIVAMVGSRAYEDAARSGAVNGTVSRRPAGSTLKPLLYALAFEQGKTRASVVFDQPTPFRDYQPRNSHDRHHGWVTLEHALGSSLNVPAVALLDAIGVPAFARRLGALGFESVDTTGARHGLPLALGAAPVSLLELAGAYAALANDGEFRAPGLLAEPAPTRRVFAANAAREVTLALSSAAARVPEFGLETPLDLPFPVAAKTGTSSGYSDNWAVGYTREFTVAVWVGNFDGTSLRGTLAMTGAAPLFHDAMFEAMQGRTPLPLTGPELVRAPSEPAPVAQDAIVLASPHANARFVLDPLLPRAQQRLPLRLDASKTDLARIARVRFLIDDALAVEVARAEPASVPLVPGAHRVRAEGFASDGSLVARSRDVHFNVTGDEHERTN